MQQVEANSVRTDSGRQSSEELDLLESPARSPRAAGMVQFQDHDEDNLEGAQTILGQIKIQATFNRNDIKFWFTLFESRLVEIGIKNKTQKEVH